MVDRMERERHIEQQVTEIEAPTLLVFLASFRTIGKAIEAFLFLKIQEPKKRKPCRYILRTGYRRRFGSHGLELCLDEFDIVQHATGKEIPVSKALLCKE